MKKSSLGKLGLVSTLVIMLLSGCVVSTNLVTVNLPSDKPDASEHLFLRYSDGSVIQVPDDTGTGSIAVNTDPGKTIVGGYTTDNVVSWVPVLSYGSSTVNVSGFAAHKPVLAADHVALFQAPAVADSAYPGYINVTFAVYGTNDELVDGQTEIFAHAADRNLIFYNTDPYDTIPFKSTESREGFSSFTVDGKVTFLIKSDTVDIKTPISLYSGAKLLADNVFHKVTGISVSSTGEGYSVQTGETLSMSAEVLPADAINPGVIWSVGNGTGSAVIDETSGELTAGEPGTVTVTATATDGTGVTGSVEVTITAAPTEAPTDAPAATPTVVPTEAPTDAPAATPTVAPTEAPTDAPAATPTVVPTEAPTDAPAATQTVAPTEAPTDAPAATPTVAPTDAPAATPTVAPTDAPAATPTVAPTPVSIPVSAITISGVSPVTVGHFVQLNQAVVPAAATNQSIVWSIENGTGTAIISAGGLLTGISAGMVTVKAAAADGSGVYGTTAIEVVASNSNSGGTPAATPSASPSATQSAAPSPTASAAPAAGGAAKFANNVVQLETVLSGFNQKVELANANPSPVSFTDISTHWADLTVETFVKLGIVQGYEDGGFHPDAGMTRAEFAAVIARVFELPRSGSRGTLSDISGHWAEAAISSLQEKGLVSGYQNGTFKPNAEISRAEIIAVIAKIVDMSGVDVPAAATFQDIGNTWNQEEIRQAAAAGIISGAGSGEFLPAKQASRAEALTIVLHVLQLNPELKALLETLK